MTPSQAQPASAKPCLRLALASLLALGVLLAAGAASAAAAEVHGLTATIGSEGSANGQFALAQHSGVGVNFETGDIYVGDTGNHRVEQFSSSGAFIRAFDGAGESPTLIAVDNSSGPSQGDLYVADTDAGTVTKLGPDGSLISGWGTNGQIQTPVAEFGSGSRLEVLGLAVATSGDLWIYSRESRLFRYTPDGSLITEFTTHYSVQPTSGGLVVDNAEDVYVPAESKALKFDSTGTELGQFGSGEFLGLARDPSNGDVYIAHSTEVDRLGATLEPLETFGGADITKASGLAAGPSHIIYVADRAKQRIDVFSLVPGGALAIDKAGAGAGVVTSKPVGIDCGATCSGEFPLGSTVTLSAKPDLGSKLAHWGFGDCISESEGNCEVDLSEAKSVEAKFAISASHALTSTLGAAGSNPPNPYPLSGPTDVAVDQSTHDLYVTDPGNHRIEKFSPSGQFLLMFGSGVNSGTANPNVCTNAGPPTDICRPGISASTPGSFEAPTYLAVDNSQSASAGDVYVADTADALVQKFDSSGRLITSWGVDGQKDGSDSKIYPKLFDTLVGLAVNGANGELYVAGFPNTQLFRYTQAGAWIETHQIHAREPAGIKTNASRLFDVGQFTFFEPLQLLSEALTETHSGEDPSFAVSTGNIPPATGLAIDPTTHELFQDTGSQIAHYSSACEPHFHLCEPVDAFGAGALSEARGLDLDGSSHLLYVANSAANDVAVFAEAAPTVTTDPPSSVTETSATLTGQVELSGHGPIVECRFEYGFTASYGHTLPCAPDPEASPFTQSTTALTASLSGLTPIPSLPVGAKYHYRFVATNESGATGEGQDETFTTTAAPTIDGLTTSHLTSTSADLEATLNSHNLDTTYRFEYGRTVSYGQSIPVPDGVSLASQHAQQLVLPIAGLERGTYHFRFTAQNDLGTVTSEDQTFEFFPPPARTPKFANRPAPTFSPIVAPSSWSHPAMQTGPYCMPAGRTRVWRRPQLASPSPAPTICSAARARLIRQATSMSRLVRAGAGSRSTSVCLVVRRDAWPARRPARLVTISNPDSAPRNWPTAVC